MLITKCLLVLLLLLPWCHRVVAQDVAPETNLREAEPETDESLDAVRGTASTQALEALPDGTLSIAEEAMMHQAPEVQDYYPALLTVVRRKQYATACQYWVKLDNRLPFMIRNLALRFSTFLKDDDYNRPVLFDSQIRNFSRLRPTDSQFRDIFYEHVDCDALNYIRVEDTGRCSIGGSTKFSAQSGDCAKFIEVESSDMICIYLEDEPAVASETDVEGEGEAVLEDRAKRDPCGIVTQQDIDDLLSTLIRSYETGDIEAFVGLFSEQVEINDAIGRYHVASQYDEVFRTTEQRSMRIGNVSWKPLMGGMASVWMNTRIKVDKGGGWSDERHLTVALRVHRRKGRLVIARMMHERL